MATVQTQVIDSQASSSYQRLDSIGCTGTQWIDTGITLDNTKKFKFDTVITASTRTGNPHPFFGTASYQTGIMGLYHYTNNTYYAIYVNGAGKNPGAISITAGSLIDYSCTLDFPNLTYSAKFNTSTGSGSITTVSDTTSHISIFYGSRNHYGLGYSLCYGFKITIDDVVVRDLVPCKRKSDNAIGMYDQVSGTFFSNSGTGTFTSGSSVEGNVFYKYIYESDSVIKFHRLQSGSTPVGDWKKGHVYFIYNANGTGSLKLAVDDSGTLEDYTQSTSNNHRHSSSDIKDIVGYSIAATEASITTSDTLNQALGKLEKKLDGIYELVNGAGSTETWANDDSVWNSNSIW